MQWLECKKIFELVQGLIAHFKNPKHTACTHPDDVAGTTEYISPVQ